MSLRVCLLPLQIEPRNPSANLQHFRARLQDVSRFQPDLICLPECTFTGYLYEEQDFVRFAEPIPGPITEAMAVLARQCGCCLCFGLLERAPEGVYDTAVLMDRLGKICLVHRKNFEHPPFINGGEVKAVETEFGRLGMLICGDLFSDEVRARLPRPLTALLVPMSRSFDGKSPDRERWAQQERQVYLDEVKKAGVTTLLVNALESSPEDASFGGALVVSAEGKILAEAPHGTDDVLIYDLEGR
ncbi:MAG: carbon-nitrogen hydrolase family protein [Anaerolineales bacterium]|jgi:predicted amidohydrolase|nr:carbon-nitrogen hydrolase family protein [Anaerolineales bacterium]